MSSEKAVLSIEPFNMTEIFSNKTQRIGVDITYNGTGYYIEEDGDIGFNEIETIFIALFATLIPLLVILTTVYGIWLMYRKYKWRKEDVRYDGMLHREGTSESVTRPLHSHLLQDKGCVDSTHLSINTEEVEVCDGTPINREIRSSNHSSTNGSIITMTLRNNHLIVETEERNDIEEDNKETTMKYSPSARDGVFVVEVQQGVRRSPGSGGVNYVEPEVSMSVSDQCALVHNPPEKYNDDDTLNDLEDSEYYVDTISPEKSTQSNSEKFNCKTGLTTSTNSVDSQHSYCYTNQQCYDTGSYGYNVYTGYLNDEPVKMIHRGDTKPKITAAVYKKPFRNLGESYGSTLTLNGIRIDQDCEIHEEPKLTKSGSLKNPHKREEIITNQYENKAFDSTDVRT